jgi:uncharacterized membrane protein (UPF0136 family)
MIIRENVYRLLLRAYPRTFRLAYEQQMLLVFRDLHRARSSDVRFWLGMLWDTIRSAPALRLEMSDARWSEPPHHNGAIMKTMAIVAMLVGALTIVNASVEGWIGGLGNNDPQSLLAGGLGVLAGVSMLLAGWLLVRRSAHALTRAQVAAAACLAAFVLILLISPRLSIFANILGIGFPLLLVAYVQVQRSRGRPTPSMG